MKCTFIIILLFCASFTYSQEEIEDDLDIPYEELKAKEIDIVTNEIGGKLLVFKRNNRFGVKDKSGKILVRPIYRQISNYYSTANRIIVEKDNYKGVLNAATGKIVVPIKYSSVSIDSDNGYIVVKDKNGERKLFDYYGNLVLEGYNEIDPINEGFIIVAKDKFYGVISPTGKEYIPTEYDEIQFIKNQKCFILKRNGVHMIQNLKGQQLFKEYKVLKDLGRNYYNTYNNIKVIKNGKVGVIDFESNVLVPLKFDDVIEQRNYNYIISHKQKMGLYNPAIKDFVINPKYDKITDRHNFYELYKGNSLELYHIDTKTKVDISGYEFIDDITPGLLEISKDKLKGVFSLKKNKIIIPVKYNEYISNNDGLLIAKNNNSIDVFYKSSKLLASNLSSFKKDSNSDYFRITKNGKVGLLKNKEIVLKIEYDFISIHNKKIILAKKNGKYALLNAYDYSFIIPFGKDRIKVDTIDKNIPIVYYKGAKYTVIFGKLIKINNL